MVATSAVSDQNVLDASPICWRLDTRRPALVTTFEHPPQRSRRVFQAMLHVDLIIALARLYPAAGERANRLNNTGM